MTVADVIGAIDEWAPPGFAYAWDKNGLHTGAPDQEVSKVLVALSVTADAFTAARKAKADMIVAHHPLIWEPLTSLRADAPHAKLCTEVAAAGIACYSAHTNLDVVPNGVNTVLAERLGLTDTAPLFPQTEAELIKLTVFVPDAHLREVREAVSKAGAGTIGDYTQCSFSTGGVGTFMPGEETDPYSGRKNVVNEEPERRFETIVNRARLNGVLDALFEAHPYEEVAYDLVRLANPDDTLSLGLRGRLSAAMPVDEFAATVREALEVTHVRVSSPAKKKVHQIAVLGGAGGSLMEKVPHDVDAYVTGDVKYHDAQSAIDRGLAVVDAGHHGTEKWIVPAMAQFLKGRLKGLKTTQFMEPDPFRVV